MAVNAKVKIALVSLTPYVPSLQSNAAALLSEAGFEVLPLCSLPLTGSLSDVSSYQGIVVVCAGDIQPFEEGLFTLASKVPIILGVNHVDEASAVEMLKLGVLDYFVFDKDIHTSVARIIYFALQQFRLSKDIEKVSSINLELLSLKQKFLQRVTREFASPLGGILSAVQILMEEMVSPKIREGLALIKQAAHSLIGLVDDAQSIAGDRSELPGMMAPFCLREQLEHLLELEEIDAGSRKVGLFWDVSIDPRLIVVGDLAAIKQLIGLTLSLLSRSLGQGCSIRVAAQASPLDSLTNALFGHVIFAFTTSSNQQNSIVTIEQLEKVVNLALLDHLTQYVKGKLWVDMKGEIGATIHLVFPLLLAHSITDILPASSGPSVNDRTDPLHVLVVDDNNVNRVVITKWLAKRGVVSTEACDGDHAVRLCEKNIYDIIFMDVQMPVMDGLEATRIIRTLPQYKSTVIVGITAHVQHGEEKVCYAAGMTKVFIKPVENIHIWRYLSQFPHLRFNQRPLDTQTAQEPLRRSENPEPERS